MAYGLKPVAHGRGGVIRVNNFTDYRIKDQYATALHTGDPVILSNEGYLNIAVGTAGTPSTNIVGVFWGCQYQDAASGEVRFQKYWTASTDATGEVIAYVYDDPDIVFMVESDQAATALLANDIGTNCDLVAASGSTVTGLSGWAVDSSATSASTAQVRILGSAEDEGKPRDGFTSAGTTMNVFVRINEHFWLSTTGI